MATVSERLSEALRIRNMSQADLVKRTGIGKSSISTYISGEYLPKQRNIYKISQALNISEAWLMGFDVPMSPQKSDVFDIDNIMPLPLTVKRPRLGVISCGEPIMTEENFEGFDDVPECINCDFTLKCEGDSMVGARINDGDIVYIKIQDTIDSGQIAAVYVDGETLLKRVYIQPDCVTLQPENPAYRPKTYIREAMNSVRILGRAVGFTSIIK